MRGLPDILRRYLRETGEWVGKNELCRMEIPTSRGGLYGADLIGRTLRSLEQGAVVAVKYVDGYSHYKYLPDYLRDLYIPTTIRTDAMWTDEKEAVRLWSHYSYAT